MLNERILNSVGRQNYNMYMLITKGEEINSILDDYSPIYQMYKYRSKVLDSQILNNTIITIDNLKESLENIFQEYISNKKFETIKNILINHINNWNINKLLEIHKDHKYYRIFRLLNTKYENWLI